jgi:hypothetical protein
VTERTFGHVAALDAFSERTLPTLPHVVTALDAYQRSLAGALQAPSELALDLDDRRGEGDDLVATLASIDQVPAAFAFALRELDGGDLRLPGILSTSNHQAAAAFAATRMSHPYASPQDVRELANGREARDPRTAPEPMREGPADTEAPGVLASPSVRRDGAVDEVVHWLGVTSTVAGAAVTYLEARDELAAVAGHGGRAAGTRGVTGASRAVAVAKKAGGRVGVVLPAVEQYLADAGDHNLTTGQRVVRVGGVAAIDAPLAGVGAAVGGATGLALTLHPAGAVAGGLAGGGMGAGTGGGLRRTRPYRRLTGWVARGVDWVLGTAHDDDYDARLGLGSPP